MSTGSLTPSTLSLRTEVQARAFGFLLLAAAATAAWFFILRPLRLAEAGMAQVEVSPKAFVFAPAAAVAGLVLLAGGGRVLPLMTRPPRGGREVAAVLGIFAVGVAFGTAGWWWMGARLNALGYAGW